MVLLAAVLLSSCGPRVDKSLEEARHLAEKSFLGRVLPCSDSLLYSGWWQRPNVHYLDEWSQPRFHINPVELTRGDSLRGVEMRAMLRIDFASSRRYLRPIQRPGEYYPEDWMDNNREGWDSWQGPPLGLVVPMLRVGGVWQDPDWEVAYLGDHHNPIASCDELPNRWQDQSPSRPLTDGL